MRILITSGGTKVPIDDVRDITNKSGGNFGSQIAMAALKNGHQVDFACAIGSKTPFSANFNLREQTLDKCVENVRELHEAEKKYRYQYGEFPYSNFSEYLNLTEALVNKYRENNQDPYDAIVLAAAVSDYTAEPISGKIRSKDDLTIKLEHATKVISLMKSWSPNSILCGFKMLVGASEQELVAAAKSSIEKSRCDLVVANDYITVKEKRHEAIFVWPGSRTENHRDDIAAKLVAALEAATTVRNEKKIRIDAMLADAKALVEEKKSQGWKREDFTEALRRMLESDNG